MHVQRPALTRNLLSQLFLVLIVACGGGADGTGSSEELAADAPEPTFDESADEDDCAILTLADVSAVTGVPEPAIEQRAISGCLYAWDGGNLNLLSTRVHDSIDRARAYHDRFTADVTAEEIAEAKEQAKEELDEENLNRGERAAGGALVDAMAEGEIRHAALDGIGSEAVVDTRGSLYIRYGNMTLTVGAKDAEGNDTFDPQMARAVGERIIANLDAM